MPKIPARPFVLPQTITNLRRVNRLVFRVADSAWQLLIIEGTESHRVSSSTTDRTDWAPGFTGDCAFNFMLSVMQTITGRRFVRGQTTSPRYVAFDRQETVRIIRRKS